MGELLKDELFDRVLLNPVAQGSDELKIVTGYSSPSMVSRHLEEVHRIGLADLKIELLIGMTGVDGVSKAAHLGFKSIAGQTHAGSFTCGYVLPGSSVHSKLYVWLKDGVAIEAWAGSANYSQNGFGIGSRGMSHHEILTDTSTESALEYFQFVHSKSIDSLHPDFDELMPASRKSRGVRVFSSDFDVIQISEDGVSQVTLPLVQLSKSPGEVHNSGAGLNWGQREGRDRNQAYIPVPSSVARAGFFPDKGVHFDVITNDNEAFVMTVAQAGDKALETPHDNSLLGAYFRKRLGLKMGEFVKTEDLVRFGSTGVVFQKLDDETYQMIYQPGINAPIK